MSFSGSSTFDTANYSSGIVQSSTGAEAFSFDALQPTNGTPLTYARTSPALPSGLALEVNITAVPEPAMMAALAGLTALALCVLMRNRRRKA